VSETILAAGTVLWRQGRCHVEIALVHRPKYDDWSLPKGKVEPGEHLATTAVRETREETGFDGVLGRFLGEVRYLVSGGSDGPVPKAVSYWAMPVLGGAFTVSGEVDRLEWVRAEDALPRLTRPDDAAPVRALLAGPTDTVSVLLVRHGHAGSRKAWKGPDDQRPLNALGRQEATAIGIVGAAFGPVSVSAADVLRCQQTVTPLATAVGTAVEPAPIWSEGRHAEHPDEAFAALHELARAGRPAAVCSQGGVIPDLLVAAGGRSLRRRPARKGSVWVLSYGAGQFVAADYLRSLMPVS
jgi:8-oxo-dGTP pyrophosphatase MutT (NUDIX family)/broad specificity phosphatase PhoE